MLHELTLKDLYELQEEKYNFYQMTKGDVWKQQYLEITEEINKREMAEKHIVHVAYEQGYKWSVWVDNNESIITGVNKKDAMVIAKQILQENPTYELDEQKLTKMEKKQNLQYLHEEGMTYNFK